MSGPTAEREIPTFPLRDYAFSGDGERGMIVGPDGAIVWMCAPRWDSDAVFSRLLGGRGGFSVVPTSTPRVSGGYYEPGTLVWHHRWSTSTGEVECHDALAYPGEDHRAIILRRVTAGDHDQEVEVSLAPRAHFGRADSTHAHLEGGVWRWSTAEIYVRAAGLADAHMADDGALVGTLTIPAGGHRDIVVELSTSGTDRDDLDADALWKSTRAQWKQVVPGVTGTASDGDVLQFFAITQGLTSRHGGMVAAATTGLPERLYGSRNYDYRYAWIRDQCFAGQADAAYGTHRILDNAVRFIGDRLRADGADLKPAYTVNGGPVPDERDLPLPGYPGAKPMAGNHANAQFQLDAFGEALSLFARAAHMGRLDDAGWEAARIAADAISSRWQEPDAGIWEIENRHWTHSRLACVSGLRGIAEHASEDEARSWNALADTLFEAVRSTAVTESGVWKRAQDDDRPDAALLIPTLRGGIDPADPANVSTVNEVLKDLGANGHLYRYRHGDEPLGATEGAFLLCEASMALALHQVGRREEAWRWFERTRGSVGPAGLFSEEWNVQERQMRGNLPQAFVHALVAQAAMELSRP